MKAEPIPELRDGEELCALDRNGLCIIQKKTAFRFGTDAVLLSDFALVKPAAKVADLGTGSGIIALLIAAHHPDAHVSAIEIQPEMADMARRSVEINGLDTRVDVREGDLRNAPALLGRGAFDQVVCNPPYNEAARSLLPESRNKLLSRVETAVSIDDVCKSAFGLLKSGGRLSVVFPARRLNDMFAAMELNRLAPKRVRCVQADASHAPRLVLLDAVKHGGAQLDWLPPLLLQNPDGSYTEEWHRIYG